MTMITSSQYEDYPSSNLSLQENFLQGVSSLIRDFLLLIGIIINIAFAIFAMASTYPIFGMGFLVSSGLEIYLFMQMKSGDQYALCIRDIQQANREMSNLLHIFENRITYFSDSFQNVSDAFENHNQSLGSHIHNLDQSLGLHIQNLADIIARISITR